MKTIQTVKITLTGIAAAVALTFAIPHIAAAHCDTLDGPVIQDANKALEAKDITPVLKWVKAKDASQNSFCSCIRLGSEIHPQQSFGLFQNGGEFAR